MDKEEEGGLLIKERWAADKGKLPVSKNESINNLLLLGHPGKTLVLRR